MKSAVQAALIFFIAQFAIAQYFGSKGGNDGAAGTSAVPAYEARAIGDEIKVFNPIPQKIAPIWPMNSSVDLSIYISHSQSMPALKSVGPGRLILEEKGFVLGDWTESRNIDTTFDLPRQAQINGSLWAHFYVALHGHVLDPAAKDYDAAKAHHFFRPLNHILPKKKPVRTKKLLSASEEAEKDADENRNFPTSGSYYHPNFTMSFIPDSGTQVYPTMHPAVRKHIELEGSGARDASGQNGWYYPVLFVNTFWQLKDHMTELNSTVTSLPIRINLNNLNNWKFSLYASIDDGLKRNQNQIASGGPTPAAGDGSEFEELKRVLVDTNIYLLSTTFVVSILHMIFEGLAFKSDIVRLPSATRIFSNRILQSHWRHKKDNVGISVRTILANVLMQGIIFLYLVDNSDGTSWMILVGQGMGILLEAWKITKTVDVRIRPAAPASWLPYKITFEDKHKLSETEKKTKEYDEIAFRYLYLVAIPLLLAYAVYSVLYDSHKSWYSFVITTLGGSVYAYGFLMMVPSLYINYRLKVSSPLHEKLSKPPSLAFSKNPNP